MKQELMIPEECLRDHVADLGKTGSGKTSSLKTIVEWLALQPQPARVCVLDPIKSDWWGVTSSSDGNRAGLPFQILGGPHGHVPLRSDQGAIVGELVGKGQLPLSIVDMADFEPGGLQRFFNEFAPALLRHIRGVLYLVLEEAHEFAPKERAGIGNENMSVHFAKKLATAGRSKGIRLLVATQRTQALHNAVLGSCETLLAHRLTAPADQKPVQDWLKANTEKDTAREIGGALAQLRTGTAYIVSAGMNFAEKVTFPRIVTFDNSATPDSDEAVARVKTAPVDRGALAEMLRVSAEEIDQTDPEKLRERIKDLERQLAEEGGYKVDPNAEAAAERRGYADCAMTVAIHLDPIMDALGDARSGLVKGQDLIATLHEVVTKGKNPPENITRSIPAQAAPPHPTMTPSVKSEPAPVGAGLTKPKQRVLDAVAWFHAIGIDPVDRDRACVMAGLSTTSSTFGVYTAELGREGRLVARDGTLSLTEPGRKVANWPKTKGGLADLYNAAAGLLKGKDLEAFDIVYRSHRHGGISRDDVCDKMSPPLSKTASTMGVYLAGLTRLGLIEAAGPGKVRPAPWLFPEGLK